MRFLLVVAALPLASCAARHDVFVGWTIDGFPAETACSQLADPQARVVVGSRDVANGPVTEETVAASCADGTRGVALSTGNFADIVVEILDGDEVYGASDEIDVSPATGAYAGEDAAEPVIVDVELEKGRLRATLRVVGERCGDAGAGDFSVTLRRKSSPLGSEVVVENQTVTCPGGEADAIFEHQPVDIGSTYEVIATTTIDGVDYATDDAGTGEGVLIEGGLTDLTVDLDVVGRP